MDLDAWVPPTPGLATGSVEVGMVNPLRREVGEPKMWGCPVGACEMISGGTWRNIFYLNGSIFF